LWNHEFRRYSPVGRLEQQVVPLQRVHVRHEVRGQAHGAGNVADGFLGLRRPDDFAGAGPAVFPCAGDADDAAAVVGYLDVALPDGGRLGVAHAGEAERPDEELVVVGDLALSICRSSSDR
jgi:hypothetical protein